MSWKLACLHGRAERPLLVRVDGRENEDWLGVVFREAETTIMETGGRGRQERPEKWRRFTSVTVGTRVSEQDANSSGADLRIVLTRRRRSFNDNL